MKTLLIPNPILQEGIPAPYVPLGLLSLATVLRDDGLDAEILDVNDICSDATFKEMPEAIIAAKPDVVGFSTWCNYYWDLIRFAAIIKEELPHVKIVFGGVQATHTDTETVKAFPQVDVIARGECDHTISRIIRSIHDPESLREVEGLTFIDRGNLVRTPDQGPVKDLDALPLPDYTLLPSMNSIERIGIDVGRGCPFRCGYCVTNSMAQGNFRQRTVENVMEVVRRVHTQYGRTYFRFEHDMLTLNRSWLLELCEALNRESFSIEWECFSRIDTVNDDLLERMAESGCSFIYFGIETGSPRMQKLLNKRLTLDRAPDVVRKTCDLGMRSGNGFIIGFPQERKSDLADTMRLIMEVYFAGESDLSEVFAWLLVPFPGSPLFEEYHDCLELDEQLSNFCVSPTTVVDLEFVKQHPKVFSTLYHFSTQHVPREVFVRVAHLMLNMVSLRYTSFALLRDPGLRYPDSLLDRIDYLPLPEGNIFHQAVTAESLNTVSTFIAQTVELLGFKDHIVHDLIRFDKAFHTIWKTERRDEPTLVTNFSYDVVEFIKEIKADGFRHFPKHISLRACSVLYRKRSNGAVDILKLPSPFRSQASQWSLGRAASNSRAK